MLLAASLFGLVPLTRCGHCTFAAVFGLSYGGLAAAHSPLVAWLFGIRRHGLIFGLTFNGWTMGCALGPIFAGYMFDSRAATSRRLWCAPLAVVGFFLTHVSPAACRPRSPAAVHPARPAACVMVAPDAPDLVPNQSPFASTRPEAPSSSASRPSRCQTPARRGDAPPHRHRRQLHRHPPPLGAYPGPGLPMTLGMEAAGVVEAVGAVSTACRWRPRGLRRRDAQPLARRVLPAPCDARERLVRLPEWMDDETAAAVFLKGLTAQYLLKGAYRSARGDGAHPRRGRRRGPSSVSGHASRRTGDRGGELGIEGRGGPRAGPTCHREHAGGRGGARPGARRRRGVDVVYDSVGATTLERRLPVRRRGNGLLRFGLWAGPPFDLFRLNRMGSLTDGRRLRGLHHGKAGAPRARTACSRWCGGIVQVRIHQRYPLQDAAGAPRFQAAGRQELRAAAMTATPQGCTTQIR